MARIGKSSLPLRRRASYQLPTLAIRKARPCGSLREKAMRIALSSCVLSLGATLVLGLGSTPSLAQQEPCIGNSGPMTGPAAFGGAAIKYGAEVAIDEINAKG